MGTLDKLDSLSYKQLRTIILWTLNDLRNAANNYSGLDERVKGWCAMLEEAVQHQINKAYNSNVAGEQQ